MPKHWFDDHPHTHVALDDAIEQGALFCNMLKDLRELQKASAAAAEAKARDAEAAAKGIAQNDAESPPN
jgi:hypothetical protein